MSHHHMPKSSAERYAPTAQRLSDFTYNNNDNRFITPCSSTLAKNLGISHMLRNRNLILKSTGGSSQHDLSAHGRGSQAATNHSATSAYCARPDNRLNRVRFPGALQIPLTPTTPKTPAVKQCMTDCSSISSGS